MQQHPLFNLEEIFDRPLKKYEFFFSVLDLSILDKASFVGRKPVRRSAIVKALIFKNLRSIANLSDLSAELYERPAFATILGFEPGTDPFLWRGFPVFLKILTINFSRKLESH